LGLQAAHSPGVEMLVNIARARDTAGMENEGQPETVPTPLPKRRWFQYSISTLLLLIAFCAVVLALFVNPALRQRRAVAYVESLGGRVSYANSRETESAHVPEWLEQRLGIDFFRSVNGVYLDGTQVSDAGLAHLKGLNVLERLSLYDTRISDAGLAQLKEMNALERLSLHSTQISDAGLTHLQGLAALEVLYLHNTQVSDAGMSRLQTALPNCRIEFAPAGSNSPLDGCGQAVAPGVRSVRRATSIGGSERTSASSSADHRLPAAGGMVQFASMRLAYLPPASLTG
jgi:hypothetical protein